ncbi:hypothetical protein IEQ34_008074 [Dendrobium chrysotoxum]|uniref:Uncharacterized protein n=1 Tax=Dendrobium chrysotoxum TaxID=161865 RepID=A0AAV7H557_DENCH|nr:hypothetical protein IEQ34_008074 [Dendrobium chrysotoxum]
MRMAQQCTYASNPYHVCNEYCSQRAARSKDSAVDESLAPKAVGVEENGEKAEVRRNVNPLCGYASNPYHKCTDFCTRRNPNKKSSQKGASFILPFMSSEGRKERVMTVSTNKVNPNCSYASNPYHQCTKHCSQRTQKMTEIEQGKPGIAAIVSTARSSRVVCLNGSASLLVSSLIFSWTFTGLSGMIHAALFMWPD